MYHFFTSIPRLGTKNARKIISELKTKLGSIEELDLSGETCGETKKVLEALESWALSEKEAYAALKQLKTSTDCRRTATTSTEVLSKNSFV